MNRPLLARMRTGVREALRLLPRPATPLTVKAFSTGLACVLVLGAVIAHQAPVRQISLDDDWQLGLAYHWQSGEIAGRDFFFTYGPLSQLVAAVATRFHADDDPLSSVALIKLGFRTVTLALLFAIVMLVPALDWRGGFMVVVLVSLFLVPVHYPSYRVLTLLVVAALAAYATLAGSRRAGLLLGGVAGFTAFLAQLWSGELGILALAVLVGVFALEWLLGRLGSRRSPLRLSEAGRLALASVTTVVGLNLLTSVVFLASGGRSLFTYQRSIIEVVSGYTATMGAPWQLATRPTLALLLAAALVYGWLVYLAWREEDASSRILVAFGLASLLSLKSAITRSDMGHIFLGFTPFFVTACCAGVVATLRRRHATLWLAIALLLIAGWPMISLEPWRDAIRTAGRPQATYRKLSRLRNLRVPPSSVLDGKLARARSSRPLLPYPYQNRLAVALDRPLVTPLLQAYAAHLPGTQLAYVRALEELGPELEVVYGVDGPASLPLDHVQTASRLPSISEYLIEHFAPRSPGPSAKGYLLLERRAEPAELVRSPIAGEPTGEGTKVTFRPSSVVDCGHLSLTIEIAYPLGAALLRPSGLQVTLFDDGGEVLRARLLPLERHGSYETFLSTSPAEIGELFRGSPQGPPWTELVLEAEEELLSVRPKRLAVTGAACLSLVPPGPSPGTARLGD